MSDDGSDVAIVAKVSPLSGPPTAWTYLRGFVSGTASGVTKLIVGHPFDTIKVRMQTDGGHGRFNGAIDCLIKTVRYEGLRSLYKGATPPLIGSAAIDTVLWGSRNIYRRALSDGGDQPLSIAGEVVAGALAGLTTVPVVTPVEQVKARLQVQYADPASNVYRGPIDCVRQLVRNNGVFGLYHGVFATVLFRLHFGLFFSSYELIRKRLADTTGLDTMTGNFIAGGLAANIFWIVALPSDLIKNKMMSQPDLPLPRRRYPSVRDCIADVYRTDGVRGFYRGFVPCLLRSFPTNGAAFVAAETMFEILPHR